MMASSSAGGGVMFVPQTIKRQTNKMAKALDAKKSNDNPDEKKKRKPLTGKKDS